MRPADGSRCPMPGRSHLQREAFRLNRVSQLVDAASVDRDTAIYRIACNTANQEALTNEPAPNRPFRTSLCQLHYNICSLQFSVQYDLFPASPSPERVFRR